MNDFYVGYIPKAPARLARFIRGIVAAMLIAAIAVAVLLVAAQQPFPASRFEYGQVRSFEGVFRNAPVPMLASDIPILLVAPGKHGAGDIGRFDGRYVRLQGSLIERDGQRMVEALLDTIEAQGVAAPAAAPIEFGTKELEGEIVDTKCYLGVMNPGSGKVHRDCAVRCISGGIPAGLLVRDWTGRAGAIVLTGVPARDLLPYVAEPVRVQGSLTSGNGVLVLRAAGITRARAGMNGRD